MPHFFLNDIINSYKNFKNLLLLQLLTVSIIIRLYSSLLINLHSPLLPLHV
uniref:Uncharacterized protein n=1 Tax=Siphoviridae sp. ctnMb19 TaxID=2825659 RepID=A0A8S5NTE7_9CAUD|nr:MAG TPA: hypothetical protein [Siphoviridae sp. ctnMb19]DAL69880.1 MAG TPA: hypothetical protein [Bacteriophage sp.]DAP02842.1 MAG TPA: hypothetical protein [Caudoviricetes sp.]DAR08376.1 MAG TPA: hypothetical protein [Caudoviricetes sp.]DAX07412.1 MAG TPA: hypothetical protein [Bacteriophage sp.]